MDIHRNVFMWGQQEALKKEKMTGASLTATRSVSGTYFIYIHSDFYLSD